MDSGKRDVKAAGDAENGRAAVAAAAGIAGLALTKLRDGRSADVEINACLLDRSAGSPRGSSDFCHRLPDYRTRFAGDRIGISSVPTCRT